MRNLFIFAILCSLTLSCSQKKTNNSNAQSKNPTEASAQVKKNPQVDKQIFDLEIGKSNIDNIKTNFSGNSVLGEMFVDPSLGTILFGGKINYLGQDWDQVLCVVKNGTLYALTLTITTSSSEKIYNTISSELKNKYDAYAINENAPGDQVNKMIDEHGIVFATNSNSSAYWDKETLVSVVKEEGKVTYLITGRN